MRWLLSIAVALGLAATVSTAQAASPLVDADWLHDNLGQSDLVVLDVRNAIDGGSREIYEQGHIPGAVYSNYLEDGWRVERDGVPGQLPPIADLEKLIGGLGIDNDDHVVVTAGGTSALDMGSATRVYWTFKVLGHEEVSVLNGGHKAYAAAYPLQTGWNAPEATEFAGQFQPQYVATREQVAKAVKSGVTLIDNRPHAQHIGAKKHPKAATPGTIPGANNVEESKLTVNGGTFVDAEQLGALLSEAGVESGGEQITFCNTGHWASLGWFAQSEILGNKQARMYDGSMTDWTKHGQPVEVKAD
ncbi:sulfurtransferase [Ferruginivarius sediminum]|uniref:Sulfurtransferase n=1 Tax=Ferruginivarius sediminum TaxID=2661937 RepID=A0A369TED4_9PROT|nr:sulfurtransferase [Ferruginivarius sediminum]RDD63663.1 sulfurtransferase [Ferruginivarius sediminum]